MRSFDFQKSHHSVAQVFRDMAVEHPVTGVADIEQDVDSVSCRNKHGVFPNEILVFHSIIVLILFIFITPAVSSHSIPSFGTSAIIPFPPIMPFPIMSISSTSVLSTGFEKKGRNASMSFFTSACVVRVENS